MYDRSGKFQVVYITSYFTIAFWSWVVISNSLRNPCNFTISDFRDPTMECSWRSTLRSLVIYLHFPKTSMSKVHSSTNENFFRSGWHFFLSAPVLRLFLEIYWRFISEFCLYYFNSEFWILNLNIWILACKVIPKYKNTKINCANIDLVGFLQKEQLLQLLPKACNFIKKETLARVCSCEVRDISKNTFFTEHLWRTAFIKYKWMTMNLE